MTSPLQVLRVLGERSFAEVGEPLLAVPEEGRGLLAVAGEPGFAGTTTVAVYSTRDLGCRAMLRTRFSVNALAFHPTMPLLAVGTGEYDGGYMFEGELLLLDWERGITTSLMENEFGRQVLGLTWLDEQALRVLLAPPDDWRDPKAHLEGHVAIVRRADWPAVPPRSLTGTDLAGPRVTAPRSDGQVEARRAVLALSPDWEHRRHVMAVKTLPDGAVLATVGREGGNQEPPARTALADGLLIANEPTEDSGRGDLRIRHATRNYVYEAPHGWRNLKETWLSVRLPSDTGLRRLFPFPWETGEAHFPGPGAEVGNGDLVYAGTVRNRRGQEPGRAFVVRRGATDGTLRWVFRTNRDALDAATDLVTDTATAYIAYGSGELVALDLHNGTPRWRHPLTIHGLPTIPTALTMTKTGRLLVGTADGRVLECATT
ncbi:hypothetical protein ACIPW5_25755 [Streptomyces sp. NPDC090077]|uniref:hypothetical protein n=1 Tax=Streptomyces sp. NPDC090077 TaxID=3365938 RepID=UPI00381A651D